jgi:hypothetical protein
MNSSEPRRCHAFVADTGEQCRRPAARFSPYCWHHRETGWLVGFVGTTLTALALVATILIFLYQERSPSLTATCLPPADGNPSELICTVENSGRRESRDAVVSFTNLLPLGTRVWGVDPVAAVVMEEAPMPPDPILITNVPATGQGTVAKTTTQMTESAAAKGVSQRLLNL